MFTEHLPGTSYRSQYTVENQTSLVAAFLQLTFWMSWSWKENREMHREQINKWMNKTTLEGDKCYEEVTVLPSRVMGAVLDCVPWQSLWAGDLTLSLDDQKKVGSGTWSRKLQVDGGLDRGGVGWCPMGEDHTDQCEQSGGKERGGSLVTQVLILVLPQGSWVTLDMPHHHSPGLSFLICLKRA